MFKYPARLERHLEMEHTAKEEERKPFVCTVCGRGFKYRANQDKHKCLGKKKKCLGKKKEGLGKKKKGLGKKEKGLGKKEKGLGKSTKPNNNNNCKFKVKVEK